MFSIWNDFLEEKRQISLIFDCVMRNANAHIVRYVWSGFSLLLVMGQASRIFFFFCFFLFSWVIFVSSFNFCAHTFVIIVISQVSLVVGEPDWFNAITFCGDCVHFVGFFLSCLCKGRFVRVIMYIYHYKIHKSSTRSVCDEWKYVRQTIARVTYNTLIFMLEIAPGGIEI